ncbi:TetR/AcrR family transcriptional regulator [Cohnella zeiphila]|uniref:TetR/AcrR family transcriptional regulator n=1 Tax=Cohnella zeiphila TaxID=2761120 RepID=UPI003B5898AA
MLREPRKKKTKELIVRTAVQLFKDKGYDNVTVEEITQLCGIAKGTIIFLRRSMYCCTLAVPITGC